MSKLLIPVTNTMLSTTHTVKRSVGAILRRVLRAAKRLIKSSVLP